MSDFWKYPTWLQLVFKKQPKSPHSLLQGCWGQGQVMGPLHPVEKEIKLLGPPWRVLVLSHSSTVLSVRESVMFILSYFRKHREESQS